MIELFVQIRNCINYYKVLLNKLLSYKIILEPKYETFLGFLTMGGKLEVMP